MANISIQALKSHINKKLNGLQIVQITQEKYNALQAKDENALYIIA